MSINPVESRNVLEASIAIDAAVQLSIDNGTDRELCASMKEVSNAACKKCETKVKRSLSDEAYAEENAELLSRCNDPSFYALFETTEHLEALEFDIHPDSIFKFKNSFQTKALFQCRKKIEKSKTDEAYRLENQVMLTQCLDTKNILMVDKEISLEVLKLYDVPPVDSKKFYNRDQVCALKYEVDFVNAQQFDQPKCYLLYELSKRKVQYNIEELLMFRDTNQANAFLLGVPLQIALKFKSDDSVQAINILKDRYSEKIHNNPHFFSWLAENVLMVENKIALLGLSLGFSVEQTVQTKGSTSFLWYSFVNFSLSLLCAFPFYFCTTAEEVDQLAFMGDNTAHPDSHGFHGG